MSLNSYHCPICWDSRDYCKCSEAALAAHEAATRERADTATARQRPELIGPEGPPDRLRKTLVTMK